MKGSTAVKTHKIRFLLVTDFQNIEAYDLKAQDTLSIPFGELSRQYAFFLPFVAGYEKATLTSESPADTKAAEKMGRLFDAISSSNQLESHTMNVFLTRLLFCFFADDTNIFSKQSFSQLIKNHNVNNLDSLPKLLSDFFAILNLEEHSPERAKYPAHLTAFPYVNGGLFAEVLEVPNFTPRTYRILLDCSDLDWSEINPDIFGSMFQAGINPKQRSTLGQHYTSVKNIMKIIQPLFLDNLYEELEKIKFLKESKEKNKRLSALLQRISEIKIFDPACGSGNFLIIAYKELRKLEIEIMKAMSENLSMFSHIHLDQFYGLEIDDFACEIARLSMWLAEHQMNALFEKELSFHQPTLPLKNSGRIHCRNSLRENWHVFVPRQSADDEVYIIGNPPFMGKNNRTDEQTKDMEQVFSGFKTFKSLDYVTSWFWKGANYIKDSKAKLALVSTNSICQGEQVAILWKPIFNLGLSIHFAYQTFAWKNSAKANAAVHTIIIGLSAQIENSKIIYKEVDGNLIQQKVENINPYLTQGGNVFIENRKRPICNVSEMVFGNMPNDGGHLLLSESDKTELVKSNPHLSKYIRTLLGADEFINGSVRYCFWLVGEKLSELKEIPLLSERITGVENHRNNSSREATRELAIVPHLFGEIRQPETGNYILIPSVSSDRRNYIPIGIFDANVISTNLNFMIPNATLYEFGILTSEMHNDFMRVVAGRLGIGYRYSATLVYNNFPFPEVSDVQKAHIEQLAEDILLTRADYPAMTLAQLYNPETMPEPLKQAHQTLDKAVEKLYRDKPFNDAAERVAFLFQRYEELTKKAV
ncbi:N-6 DNA methylase [Actinobacillus equuli subsp. haemolyticus]|nr:DNA methyltransferase [Actinobacillus equuli]WGE41824.1 N-6 DNA methylase [Actinobacillus equuli subsp. haemolyticus]